MNSRIAPELLMMKQELLDNMTEYREECAEEDGDYPYGLEDIQACDRLLTAYLTKVGEPSSGDRKTHLLDVMRRTVLELNQLNAKCESPLIETMEREMIVELLMNAAVRQGLPADLGDVTLEWRDW